MQKYHADNPVNSIVITVNPCFKSAKAVLKLIALELGVPISQSTDDLWLAIAQKLHDGMVIIIDEGQLLTFHGIETIRSFADYFPKELRRSALLLSATMALKKNSRVKPGGTIVRSTTVSGSRLNLSQPTSSVRTWI